MAALCRFANPKSHSGLCGARNQDLAIAEAHGLNGSSKAAFPGTISDLCTKTRIWAEIRFGPRSDAASKPDLGPEKLWCQHQIWDPDQLPHHKKILTAYIFGPRPDFGPQSDFGRNSDLGQNQFPDQNQFVDIIGHWAKSTVCTKIVFQPGSENRGAV